MTPVFRYRRPPELTQIGTRHAVVEASAGTGKTYILEHLVVDLLLRGNVELDRILVVTFTEKATAELVQRLRGKLQQLRDLDHDHDAEGAADADCWIIDVPARARLRDALLSFDRSSVSTIHGFCQRLLTEYAFLQRRLFDEELIDEKDAFHVAFVETIRRDVAPDPVLGSLLAIWMETRSLDRLEETLARAHRELACLYPPRPQALRPAPVDADALGAVLRAFPAVTPEDARLRAEMKALRLTAASTQKKVNVCLAGLARIAAEHRAGAALGRVLADIEAAEALPYLVEKLADVPDGGAGMPLFAHLVRRLDRLAPPLAAELAQRVLPLVGSRLEAHKREAGLYDFNDMLVVVARSLEGDGARARTLRAALRGRFRHALIDEFQDTDEIQWSIFHRLFLEGDGGHVVTLIGDPKQAIYSFRGAEVQTYLRARKEIVAGGGARVPLVNSFRSTASLIDACNLILDQTAPSPFFRAAGDIRYDQPVVCGRPALALCDHAGRPAAPVVVLDVIAEAANLLTWQIKQTVKAGIVAEIRQLLSPAGALALRDADAHASTSTRIGPGEIFVLTRTTRESREIGDALLAAQIPFAFYKQERLFDTAEAREVLDLLRAIADPDDRTARSRAFITAFFGLALPELAACDDLPAGHPLMARLLGWKALADAGQWEALLAAIVRDSGIVCRELFLRTTERHLTNYLHLLELLQEETARTRGTIRELAGTLGAWISGERRPPGQGADIQRLETDARAVQIMTIHHSKGLEAAAVFIYGGFWPGGGGASVRAFHDDEGRRAVRVGKGTPAEEARAAEEQDDEERRVLYVALTRARGRLYLPRYPREFKQLRGSYRFVNQRLDALLGGFLPEREQGLFARVRLPCPGGATAEPVVAPSAVLASWQPDPDLLVPDRPDDEPRALAATRAGFVVTSYSTVKRRHGGFVAPGPVDDPAANEEAGASLVTLPEDELPRGRLSGSFLHAVLEEVDLASLRAAPLADEWRARPEVAALFARLGRRHDRHAIHYPHAAHLVHTALATPLRLGETIVSALCAVEPALRELEFLYPIPERGQPRLGGAAEDEARFRIGRGVVKGFIDLLFQHDGRVYVCDWKGDWLPSWESERVAAHCLANYDAQARIYALAALRLAGITDESGYTASFGGIVYCFLRGRRPDDPDAGVFFNRPLWNDVVGWEREMLGDDFWRLG